MAEQSPPYQGQHDWPHDAGTCGRCRWLAARGEWVGAARAAAAPSCGRLHRFRRWCHEWAVTLKIRWFDRELYRQLTRPLPEDGWIEVARPGSQQFDGPVAGAADQGTDRVFAPWDDEQVASLNDYQTSGAVHPFTGRNDLAPDGEEDVLVATRGGWVSRLDPDCRQDWAWCWMTDRTWEQFTIPGAPSNGSEAEDG